jgi:hypothetical protein
MTAPHDIAADMASAWYRQPVLWLGLIVFLASIAGCVWIIVMSVRYADTPLETSHAVFGVPVSAHSSRARPASRATP